MEYRRTLVDYYDLFFEGIPGDVDFYVEEARRAGSPVLELGCGTGRILIPVAEAGINVVGLDSSNDMLSAVCRKAESLQSSVASRIQTVEGDMTAFSLERQFSLIMIPLRSFLHLLTTEDQRRALHCIHEHLADSGRFVLNMFDPKLDALVSDSGVSTYCQEAIHPQTGNRITYRHSERHDHERQLRTADFVFEEYDAEGQVISIIHEPVTIRWAYRYEMEHLLDLCGFDVEALYGDFQRGPFTYGGEQIWVCTKRR